MVAHGVPRVGQVRPAHAAQPGLARFQMHHPETGGEIEHGRDQRGDDNGAIGHVERFGHDEGHCPHDRRHDLPAHGRGRLDTPGKGGAEAEPLHQGNGELAAGHHIGDAGPGNGAHQRRRQRADLGGAAAPAADQAEGEIVEQPDHAGALEKGGKDHEDEDIGRGDIDGGAIDALGAEAEMLDDLREIIAAMHEGAGHVLAEETIGEEQAGDDDERQAHEAPGRLEDEDDHHRAGHEVGRGEEGTALEQVGVEDPVVETGRKAEHGQGPEDNAAKGGLGHQIAQQAEAEQQEKADMHGAHDLAGQRAIGGGPELEEREGYGNGKGDAPHDAGAEAGRQALDGFFGGMRRRRGGRG